MCNNKSKIIAVLVLCFMIFPTINVATHISPNSLLYTDLHVETLLTSQPSDVWVNNDWINLSNGDIIDGHIYGEDAFSSIGDGIKNVDALGTVYVYSGTYEENVVIDRQIDLIGKNEDRPPGDDTGAPIVDGRGVWDVVLLSASANKVNITGFIIQNSGDQSGDAGIEIKSQFTYIDEIIVRNTTYGIYLQDCTNNIITSSMFENTSYAIVLSHSDNNHIMMNTLMNTTVHGISLFMSSENIIKENTITFSKGDGIQIRDMSTQNTISKNNIRKNIEYGIEIFNSSNNNLIYLNEFNNTRNAWDLSSNQWDNGTVGNYWSDYEGDDLYPQDGIGDEPYAIPPVAIPPNNWDNKPLYTFYDLIPPSIHVRDPSNGYLYIMDRAIQPIEGINWAIIIGKITFVVDADDNPGGSGIKHVEFYLDNILSHVETETGPPSGFYNWPWDEHIGIFGDHTYTFWAIAYDKANNDAPSREVNIWIWNP